MTTPPENTLRLGRLGRPHGLHGAIKFHAVDAKTLGELRNIWVQGQGWQHIEKIEWHNKQPVLRLAGCNTLEQAKTFTNLEAYAEQAALHVPDGQYLYSDLIGASASAPDGKPWGEVADVMDTGAQDVLVIHHNGRVVLVPLQAPYVQINHESGTLAVTIEAVPGLFDDQAEP